MRVNNYLNCSKSNSGRLLNLCFTKLNYKPIGINKIQPR
jgi:hypothetical protein